MKKLCLVALATIVSLALVGLTNAGEIKTITLDGNFDEWENVPVLLSRTATSYPNYPGTTYYWNNDTNAWQTTALDNACMYNDSRSLDLTKIKFANNENYLYFYWEKHSDYMNYFWKTFPNDPGNNTLDEASFSTEPVPVIPDPQANQSSPPCAGETIYNPVDFNHDMVFSFDTDLDMKANYYLVMNVVSPQGSPGVAYSYTVTSYIYKDNGNGTYDGRDHETLISDLGSDYIQIPSAFLCPDGVCQEGRLKINEFFTDLKIEWNDAVVVNYEAFTTKLFGSKKAVYAFNKKNKLGLKLTSPKKARTTIKKRQLTLKGTVKKGSTVKIFVNGKKKEVFVTGEKKFTKVVRMPKKKNAVVVKAIKGKKKVVKGVFVKRK